MPWVTDYKKITDVNFLINKSIKISFIYTNFFLLEDSSVNKSGNSNTARYRGINQESSPI